MNHTVSIRSEKAYDVVVCGAGPSGFPAALAARRQGLSVLLVEAYGQIGGMGTSGLVSHWLAGRTSDAEHWVVGGIFRSLSIKAKDRGIALITSKPEGNQLSPHGWTSQGKLMAGIPFDPFAMASLLDEVMEEAGVDVLFFTRVVDVIHTDSKIESVILHNKSGFSKIHAKYVIDATGDADIAAFAGCETVLGREEDNLMTPVTLQMHMDGVNTEALAEYQNARGTTYYRFLEEIKELREQGEWPFLYDRLITVQMPPYSDTYMVNTSRLVGYDGTDAASVSKAMAQGRKESLMLQDILRKHFPGFEQARIRAIATALGVRETRRIIGEYVLTMQELADEKPIEDIIGFVCGSWDLPDPLKPSYNDFEGKNIRRSILPIPYRVMIPKPIQNLVCPGRAVSVDRPILGPFRDQAGCMAMGEAAGTAAGLACKGNVSFQEVDVNLLRNTLVQHGGIVELDEIFNNPVFSPNP